MDAMNPAKTQQGAPNLLMLSGDRDIARGRKGPFHYTMAAFRQYWQRIDVIVPTQPGAAAGQPFPNVFIHPSGGGRLSRARHIAQQADALLDARAYGLIVSHDYGLFHNGRAAARLAADSGVPYVSEIFHVPGHPRAADLTERIEKRLYRLYVHWANGRAAAFRAGNEREIPALYRAWGVPPARILVLPSHYLDLDAFAPRPEAKAADAIIVCRLVKNKGLFLLLDALALARRRKPDITLHIVGEGPLRQALDRHVARHGLGRHVRFLGWLPDQAAVARAYNAARVVVCASFTEGGPRTTLEGMACGLPAVSTPVGAMPEVIRPGENGYLVDWTSESLSAALLAALESESHRQGLGAAARASVLPFARESAIRRYAYGYLQLIGAAPENSTSHVC